jgi:[ribosomal protein S18]-alanine N-acetyltransferase
VEDSKDVEGMMVPTVSIRRAESTDVPAMAAIESGAFSNPWHPHTFRSLVTRDGAMVLVAEDPEDGVVGYAVSWWVLDEAELANLAVREDHRGCGVGSALLDRLLDEIRALEVDRVFLEVRISNERAHGLYLKRGFTQIGVRKGYYQNPREDARILVRRID